jgi:hypothetical protein
MRRLLRPLWFVVAVVFLVEGWLWQHLAAAVARLVERLAWPAWRARVAAAIDGLPPTATLLVFLIPIVVLLPVKLLGLWLLARGAWLTALLVLVVAKIVSTALTAFIFQLTRPKLLQLGWFRWVHDKVVAALAWAHRQIDPWKQQVRDWSQRNLAPRVARLRQRLRALFPENGRLMRRLARLRRRARRTV